MQQRFRRALCLATALFLALGLSLGCTAAVKENTDTTKETAQTAEASEPVGSVQTDGSEPHSGDRPDGTPPDGMGEPPSGGRPDGTPPNGMGEPPSGQRPEGTPPGGTVPLSGGPGGSGGGPGGPGGAPGGSSAADIEYSGAVEITSADSQKGQTYATETVDESALLISTAEAVTVSDPTVTKTGSSNGGDSCNFYGLNAAVLCKDGAQVTITGGEITSDASGANGIFCYGGNGGQNGAAGDGTTVTVTGTVITTTGSGSGGIMTTGGGVTYANDLTVTTSGQSSAPIRTDRGGGTVYVNGGVYTSNGLGSPAIYSTAEIHVSNATLTSNLSEGVCIEGKNSIELTNCELTANNTACNGNATFLDTVMIYQSMSGDADSGTSAFTMTGGTLKSQTGHVFHVTNTSAIITLSGVEIVNEDGEGVLLSVCDDGWSGAGNVATLNARGQTLEGLLLVGSDATLTLNLTEGSVFTGTVSGAITNAKGDAVSTEVGTVHVTVEGASTWVLTGDTYIASFTGDASSIVANGYTLYVDGVALTGTK